MTMATTCPGLPETVLVYIYFLNVTISSTSFHAQKSPVWLTSHVTQVLGFHQARICGSQHVHVPATT